MPNSQICQLYAFKVVFTKEILSAPVVPPGEFGPALERSNWTLLNDQSLNVAAVLLFFFTLPAMFELFLHFSKHSLTFSSSS